MNVLVQPYGLIYKNFWPDHPWSSEKFAGVMLAGAPLGAIGAGGYMMMKKPGWAKNIPGGYYAATSLAVPMAAYGGSVVAPAMYTAWNHGQLQREKKFLENSLVVG